MTTDKADDSHKETVRVVLFVFMLLSLAEIAAPYFHVSFSDPLMIGVFVTGAIGSLFASHERALRAHYRNSTILVMKDSAYSEFCDSLKNNGEISRIRSILMADTAADALQMIRLESKPTILDRLKTRTEKFLGLSEQSDGQ